MGKLWSPFRTGNQAHGMFPSLRIVPVSHFVLLEMKKVHLGKPIIMM